jgi:hypothetical protein
MKSYIKLESGWFSSSASWHAGAALTVVSTRPGYIHGATLHTAL